MVVVCSNPTCAARRVLTSDNADQRRRVLLAAGWRLHLDDGTPRWVCARCAD